MLAPTSIRARVAVAMHEAADHIEANPERFDFESMWSPEDAYCGTPGCAIGWTAFFLGDEGLHLGACATREAIQSAQFYGRMDRLVGVAWMDDAATCARGMRLYADELLSAEVSRAG